MSRREEGRVGSEGRTYPGAVGRSAEERRSAVNAICWWFQIKLALMAFLSKSDVSPISDRASRSNEGTGVCGRARGSEKEARKVNFVFFLKCLGFTTSKTSRTEALAFTAGEGLKPVFLNL